MWMCGAATRVDSVTGHVLLEDARCGLQGLGEGMWNTPGEYGHVGSAPREPRDP